MTYLSRRSMLAAALAAGTPFTAFAQARFEPTKPVRIVVPFGAGGATDILARTLAEKLTRVFGQPVLVENRAGASGIIGIGEVARAAADGHTLLVTNTALLQTPLMDSKVAYEVSSFTPVAQLSLSPLVFSVNPKVPAKDMNEFLALARAQPGVLSYGSAGTGQTLHLMGEILTRSSSVKLNHVPYKGEAPLINDLIAGHVTSGFSSIAVARQHIKSGTLRPLAVVAPARSSLMPNVPTMKEAGLNGFEVMSWFGLFAPAGTPKAIVDAVHREVANVLRMPDVVTRLEDLALNPVTDVSPAEFQRIVTNDYAAWGKIIRDAGVKPPQ